MSSFGGPNTFDIRSRPRSAFAFVTTKPLVQSHGRGELHIANGDFTSCGWNMTEAADRSNGGNHFYHEWQPVESVPTYAGFCAACLLVEHNSSS